MKPSPFNRKHVNVQLDEIYIAIGSRHLIEISTNVGKTIITIPNFTINRLYKSFPNGWFIIVLTCFNHITCVAVINLQYLNHLTTGHEMSRCHSRPLPKSVWEMRLGHEVTVK